MSRKIYDSVRGRSDAFSKAMERSAQSRQCPKCGRKSAIKRLTYEEDAIISRYCRWDDCDYAVLRKEWR